MDIGELLGILGVTVAGAYVVNLLVRKSTGTQCSEEQSIESALEKSETDENSSYLPISPERITELGEWLENYKATLIDACPEMYGKLNGMIDALNHEQDPARQQKLYVWLDEICSDVEDIYNEEFIVNEISEAVGRPIYNASQKNAGLEHLLSQIKKIESENN